MTNFFLAIMALKFLVQHGKITRGDAIGTCIYLHLVYLGVKSADELVEFQKQYEDLVYNQHAYTNGDREQDKKLLNLLYKLYKAEIK